MDELATTTEQATNSVTSKNRAASTIDKPKTEKIRVELNIEKWPGIWQPAKAHTKLTVRTLERQVEVKGAGRASSKLLVGFTDLGTLTTEDQRMFYALIRQWEDAGKPVGKPVYFSDRLLSRLLKKKGWGTNVIEAITGSLRRLRTIPLRWIKSFHKNDSASSEYEEEIPFQILGDLKIVTRRAHGHVTNQQGYFQFDRNIEANLHANYTKPLLDEVFFSLESEIAQLLYTHIDLVMFGKTRYERCTKELFADLGLSGASYRYKSNRKQKLQRALNELCGIRLNHGVIKSAAIEETHDGKDYKVVFTKASRTEAEPEPQIPAGEGTSVVVNHYARAKDPFQAQAEELVRYFHEVFHSVHAHEPQLKETSQASTLLAQHGLEQCRHIVEFAHTEALKTKYSPQHFGAILNYTSRAITYHQHQQNAKQQQVPKAVYAPRISPGADEPNDQIKRARGESRLAALRSDQYQARFEQTRAQLSQKYPAMARLLAKKGSESAEKAVRGWMIRRLADEPMHLLILDSGTDPEAVRRKLGLQNLAL